MPDPTADSASPDELLMEYLRSGDSKSFDRLRFWKTAAVLQRVKTRLENHLSPSELSRTLELLKGYQSRQRSAVVDVVLTHWPTLSKADYGTAVQVLTRFEVPPVAQEILGHSHLSTTTDLYLRVDQHAMVTALAAVKSSTERATRQHSWPSAKTAQYVFDYDDETISELEQAIARASGIEPPGGDS